MARCPRCARWSSSTTRAAAAAASPATHVPHPDPLPLGEGTSLAIFCALLLLPALALAQDAGVETPPPASDLEQRVSDLEDSLERLKAQNAAQELRLKARDRVRL